MPFRWHEIFSKENEIAKARANAAVDAHADPHALVALAIRQLQEQHDELEGACSRVLAEYNVARERLQRDLERERQLDARGRAAAGAGHADAASAIATQLVSLRNIITTEKGSFDRLQASAEQARQAFQENSEMLAAKMQEASELDAQIDQAAVEHNINEAMRSVSSVTSRSSPSFEQVRERVQMDRAREEATTELDAADPGVSEIHQQHLLNRAAADDVMAGWGAPAPTPRDSLPSAPEREGLPPPPPRPAASPADRLNS